MEVKVENTKSKGLFSRAKHLKNAFPLSILHSNTKPSGSIDDADVKIANSINEDNEKAIKNIDLANVSIYQVSQNVNLPLLK